MGRKRTQKNPRGEKTVESTGETWKRETTEGGSRWPPTIRKWKNRVMRIIDKFYTLDPL